MRSVARCSFFDCTTHKELVLARSLLLLCTYRLWKWWSQDFVSSVLDHVFLCFVCASSAPSSFFQASSSLFLHAQRKKIRASGCLLQNSVGSRSCTAPNCYRQFVTGKKKAGHLKDWSNHIKDTGSPTDLLWFNSTGQIDAELKAKNVTWTLWIQYIYICNLELAQTVVTIHWRASPSHRDSRERRLTIPWFAWPPFSSWGGRFWLRTD